MSKGSNDGGLKDRKIGAKLRIGLPAIVEGTLAQGSSIF